MEKRSLYDCQNAQMQKKPGDKIEKVFCFKGHQLPDAAIPEAVHRGAPMIYTVCQGCGDFSPADPPFPFPAELKGSGKGKVKKGG